MRHALGRPCTFPITQPSNDRLSSPSVETAGLADPADWNRVNLFITTNASFDIPWNCLDRRRFLRGTGWALALTF